MISLPEAYNQISYFIFSAEGFSEESQSPRAVRSFYKGFIQFLHFANEETKDQDKKVSPRQ